MTNEVTGEERDKKLLSVIERMIGAEVDKLSPRAESRNTLVLMALGRVHPVADQVYDETDVRYLVFDEKGQARTKNEDGQDVAFTIAEVVAELKQRYPKLFEQAAAPGTPPRATAQERDWLQVASTTEEESAQQIDGSTLPVQPMNDGEIYSHGEKFQSLAGTLKRQATQVEATLTQSVHSRPWMRSALAFLIGAVVFLTLLALVIGDTDLLSEKSEVPVTGNTSPANSAQMGSPSVLLQRVVRGVPEVIDTTTLKIGNEVIHLHGVEWARGGNADQLRQYLGDRETVCERLGADDVFRCEVDGKDLSVVVLFNGGAQTAANAPPDLRAAEEYAKSEGKGVWKK